MNSISKNIKKLRLEKKLTQEELAIKMFVTRQTVSNWENGKSRPDIDTLIKIAEILDTNTNALIYGQPDSNIRKKEKTNLVIAAGVLFIIALALYFFMQYTKEHAIFFTSPIMFLRLYLLPLFWLVLGWIIIQTLSFFGIVKPFKSKYCKIVRIAVLAIVLFYTTIMLPYLIQIIDSWVLWSQYMKYPASGFTYEYDTLLPHLFSNILRSLMTITVKYPVIFVLPGILYRLFKPVKGNLNKNIRDHA